MRCRALCLCTAGGHTERRGKQCLHEATEAVGTATAPSLCWLHARAARNRSRLVPLELAPLSLSAAVAALFPTEHPSPPERS